MGEQIRERAYMGFFEQRENPWLLTRGDGKITEETY